VPRLAGRRKLCGLGRVGLSIGPRYTDPVDVGFETIGNAILIAYDDGPVIATDPWFRGGAYFGSWGQQNEIPEAQIEAIKSARFAWISHGHPDHLSDLSLRELKGKPILLPDHVGGRIPTDLALEGHDVRVLPERKWVQLSDRIRAFCISDYNQDAILLLDINGRLVVNLTDASDYGWEYLVRRIVKDFDTSILLWLSSRFGDADMLNYFDEDGHRIPRPENVGELGARNLAKTRAIGCTHFAPFSSMHVMQRADSFWAYDYRTEIEDYRRGWDVDSPTLLPAYVQYDCSDDSFRSLNPPHREPVVIAPEEFGDDWSDQLEAEDVRDAAEYFQRIEKLHAYLSHITLKVGGREHTLDIDPRRGKRSITFEAPRYSLMHCIRRQIFDDMLIGNYVKCTLHGDWPTRTLYPDFTPYVAKYGDNGRAYSNHQIERYFREFWKRDPMGMARHRAEDNAELLYRALVPDDSLIHRMAKGAFHFYKQNLR
jgi:hypothetical protein